MEKGAWRKIGFERKKRGEGERQSVRSVSKEISVRAILSSSPPVPEKNFTVKNGPRQIQFHSGARA